MLNKKLNVDEFFTALQNSKQSLLFLDYDGTLAPFHIDRRLAFPYHGINDTLNTLINKSNTIVIIMTGRAIQDLIPLIKLDKLPEIWGNHGGEHLFQEKYQQYSLTSLQKEGLDKGLESAKKYLPLERCESKTLSIAAHWRGMTEDEIEKTKNGILQDWNEIAKKTNLGIYFFDGGIELRPKEISKGQAVKNVLKRFSSDVPLAYLGDDFTDEEAFEAIGNRGLKVSVGNEPKQSLADLQIRPPDELLGFLNKWIKNTFMH